MANKTKLLIAIGLVVVVGAAAYFLLIRPRGGGGAPTEVAQEPTAPSAPAPAAPPEAAPTPAAPAAPAAGAAPAPAAAPVEIKEPYRADPFKAFPMKPRRWVPVPLVVRFPVPVSMARVFERATGPQTLAERRRVAGLLYDDRVWALYESQGQISVVKPGDIVEDGTVQAITDEGVLLQETGGGKPVLVPLARGSTAPVRPTGTRPGLVPGAGAAGAPASPGWFPGGSPL